MKLSVYVIVGIILWVCMVKSGVHATLVGVILAMAIPMKGKGEENYLGKELEHHLHPWVAFAVLPLFAFANAGVPLAGVTLDFIFKPITLGIILGLFFGKQLGILLFTRIGVWLKLCQLPNGISWRQFYGIALLGGIGFTMSLFIGTLAFDSQAAQNAVRTGVLIGSLASGIAGYWFLRTFSFK